MCAANTESSVAGPGRLGQALGINPAHNGARLNAPPFRLTAGDSMVSVVCGPRIGISKAVDLPWRFGLADSRYPAAPLERVLVQHFGDTMLYLTADELAGLAEEVQAMADRFLDRTLHPELRPPGARPVTYLHLAFPGDLSGAAQPPADADQ